MKVFLSYAHTPADERLAFYVEARLRAAGIGVWMDKSSLNAGQPTRQAIQDAAAGCDHGVFIVSPSWLTRDWTEWELGLFEARDPGVVRRIPILREPRKNLALPPLLFRFTGFEWLDDDQDPDARIWELYSAIHGTAPGPLSDWSSRGQELKTSADTPDLSPPPPPPPSYRPSIRCDRALQWKTVDDLAGSGRNELLLLPGDAGQDHDHFIQRVQYLLRADPPRRIERVDWPSRPGSREEYQEALARAMHVEVPRLSAALGERLASKNIVLLHPCIRSGFLDEPLIDYYTQWLPAWLSDARPRMNVKCVQPVEWPPESRWFALTRWTLGRASEDDDKPAAEQMMHQCLESAAAMLRAVRLNELHDLSQEDLDDFYQVEALSNSQREWLAARISARQAKSPKDVFRAIDDYLPDARSRA
jgi:hypothetical protein